MTEPLPVTRELAIKVIAEAFGYAALLKFHGLAKGCKGVAFAECRTCADALFECLSVLGVTVEEMGAAAGWRDISKMVQ